MAIFSATRPNCTPCRLQLQSLPMPIPSPTHSCRQQLQSSPMEEQVKLDGKRGKGKREGFERKNKGKRERKLNRKAHMAAIKLAIKA
ncbi:hypothetical protein C1H46_031498 [Malus baccata]|uniref:Uncharacterized protein n=1 Tax=Malus baccata TaxID=106549 RepID=A0A540L8W6_MALBA|nr:hypothetical protein C1H46_031498 [Malus baccata]